MSEITVWIDPVAHELFEDFCVRETFPFLAVPDQRAINGNSKNSASARRERHFANVLPKGLQKLLRHPSGAQQPLALGAVGYDDARSHKWLMPRF